VGCLDIVGYLIHLLVTGIIVGIFVWLAGKALGAPKATYYHGILTVIAAIILGDIIGYVIPWHLAVLIVDVIVILLLIKHFFGVGWLKAIVIAVLAAVIAVIIIFVLGLLLPAAAVTLKGLVPEVQGYSLSVKQGLLEFTS
jgi:hypothetical protein